jgi:hypothetical protein
MSKDTNSAHYLEFQRLPFAHFKKKQRFDVPLEQLPEKRGHSFQDARVELSLGKEQEGKTDVETAAAAVLLGLAHSIVEDPQSSKAGASPFRSLTDKGRSRSKSADTRVSPPNSVTRLLFCNWPRIRMPDIRCAMEAEDWVTMYCNFRYPEKLPNDTSSGGMRQMMNFHLSYYDQAAVTDCLSNLFPYELSKCIDSKKKEVEDLKQFLKERYRGAAAKKQVNSLSPLNDRSFKSHTTNIDSLMDTSSIRGMKMKGIVKSGSILWSKNDSANFPEPGSTKESLAVSFKPSGFSLSWPSYNTNRSDMVCSNKLRNASTVIGGSMIIDPERVHRSCRSSTDATNGHSLDKGSQENIKEKKMNGSNASRGRRASYDSIVEWCVNVRRAAAAKYGVYATIDSVCALSNDPDTNPESTGKKINSSTLRKRIKHLYGISWTDIGTDNDRTHGDVNDAAICLAAGKLKCILEQNSPVSVKQE